MVFCCKIQIGDLLFDSFSTISIKESWRLLTDTAEITMPKDLHYYDGSKLKPIGSLREKIKTGDKVIIQLGYNRQLITRFKGYVARSPQPTLPILIECEDEMWQLKRKQVSVSIADATVLQIIKAAAPGYVLNVVDEIYGDFSMLQTTPAKIFDELKKNAGIYVFFRNGVLTAGKVYSDERVPDTVANFKFGENIIDTSLKYISPEDTKLKIYGSSTQANGTIVREEVGEEGGDIVRINLPGGYSKESLKKLLERRYNLTKNQGGYDGSLTTFGFPVVAHGQPVRIYDDIYEQRDTTHFADAIEIKASLSDGYRQIIDIGKTY